MVKVVVDLEIEGVKVVFWRDVFVEEGVLRVSRFSNI